MADRKRILLTGASGYIGHAVLQRLLRSEEGHEVYALSRGGSRLAQADHRPPDQGSPETLRAADLTELLAADRIIHCDLFDGDTLKTALAPLAGKIDAIVHCAAANSRSKLKRAAAPGGVFADPNQAMLANLLAATRSFAPAPRWVHLSSVSVYGDAGRTGATRPDAPLRPSGAYGRSKLACEQLLQTWVPPLRDLRILRVTPVFSPEAPRNLLVRVCLPGTSLPLRIWPEPRHSLLSLSTLVAAILTHVHDSTGCRTVENLTDSRPYSQHRLIERSGKRFALPIPEYILRPIYYGCYLLPARVGYGLRCFYWKLFRSNVYAQGQVDLPERDS